MGRRKTVTSMTAEINVMALRKSLGLNQTQFWTRLGVTQSAGSRYESGRTLPAPMALLVRLVYGLTGPKAIEALAELRGEVAA